MPRRKNITQLYRSIKNTCVNDAIIEQFYWGFLVFPITVLFKQEVAHVDCNNRFWSNGPFGLFVLWTEVVAPMTRPFRLGNSIEAERCHKWWNDEKECFPPKNHKGGKMCSLFLTYSLSLSLFLSLSPSYSLPVYLFLVLPLSIFLTIALTALTYIHNHIPTYTQTHELS